MTKSLRVNIAILAGVLAFGISCLFYAYFIEPNRLVVRNRDIVINGWDTAFDGFRIVAVSDIHGGSNGGSAANIRHLVETVNEQRADIVVLLGDFVSYDRSRQMVKMPITEIAGYLGEMRAKYGVFAVLGNHDGWYGDEKVASELRTAGITILKDEMATVSQNTHKLRIFGIRDHFEMGSWRKFDSDLREKLSDSEQEGGILVLEHSPDVFPVINEFNTFGEDFKLMIAGHTHGGQVWLPIIGSPIVPSSYGQKYNYGHIIENGRHLFVTTGTGTSILPMRFLMPPEVVVLTIRAS